MLALHRVRTKTSCRLTALRWSLTAAVFKYLVPVAVHAFCDTEKDCVTYEAMNSLDTNVFLKRIFTYVVCIPNETPREASISCTFLLY